MLPVNYQHLSPVSIQTQSLALRLDGNRALGYVETMKSDGNILLIKMCCVSTEEQKWPTKNYQNLQISTKDENENLQRNSELKQ